MSHVTPERRQRAEFVGEGTVEPPRVERWQDPEMWGQLGLKGHRGLETREGEGRTAGFQADKQVLPWHLARHREDGGKQGWALLRGSLPGRDEAKPTVTPPRSEGRARWGLGPGRCRAGGQGGWAAATDRWGGGRVAGSLLEGLEGRGSRVAGRDLTLNACASSLCDPRKAASLSLSLLVCGVGAGARLQCCAKVVWGRGWPVVTCPCHTQ